MQIHELTRPRKINEGFGSALAGQLMTKALGANPLDQDGPRQSREAGFASMVNSPEAKTLATTMQSAWQQTVHNFLMNSKDANGNPATSIKTVTQPSVDSLEPELRALVNKMIAGRNAQSFDYATMANGVTDPVIKQGIQEIIARITEHTQAIYKGTVQGIDPKALIDNWIKLVGDGVLPAQNARAYDLKNGASSKARLYKDPLGRSVIDLGNGPEWFDIAKPDHKKVWDEYSQGKATT